MISPAKGEVIMSDKLTEIHDELKKLNEKESGYITLKWFVGIGFAAAGAVLGYGEYNHSRMVTHVATNNDTLVLKIEKAVSNQIKRGFEVALTEFDDQTDTVVDELKNQTVATTRELLGSPVDELLRATKQNNESLMEINGILENASNAWEQMPGGYFTSTMSESERIELGLTLDKLMLLRDQTQAGVGMADLVNFNGVFIVGNGDETEPIRLQDLYRKSEDGTFIPLQSAE